MTSRRVISREQRQCSAITPYLYVSGLAALSPRVLSRFCVTINFIPGFRLIAPDHMKVVEVPLQDNESTDISPYFELVHNEIEEARKKAGRALLLCAMGISRSATFGISYVMKLQKKTLHDAYKTVQGARNIICPNVGFFEQLIQYEKKTRGNTSVTIIEPISGVKVADVVWNELYDEMMSTMSLADRHSLASLNLSARSTGDTQSLRSMNAIDETGRSLASCRLSDRPKGCSPTFIMAGRSPRREKEPEPGPAPLQRAATQPEELPKSALRDKSKSNEKRKKWRLSFHKDVA